MLPVATRLPLLSTPVPSVTDATVGSPMVAASLVPTIVNDTSLVVPSSDVTVKVSVLLSPCCRYSDRRIGHRIGVGAVRIQGERAEVAVGCRHRGLERGLIMIGIDHRDAAGRHQVAVAVDTGAVGHRRHCRIADGRGLVGADDRERHHLVVPSSDVTVKLSVLLSPCCRYSTAEFATV